MLELPIRMACCAILLPIALFAAWLVGSAPLYAVAAAPETGAEYAGSMSDGGSVHLTVTLDPCLPRYPGEPVCSVPFLFVDAYLAFRNPPLGCPIDTHVLRVPLAVDGSEFRVDNGTILRPGLAAKGESGYVPSETVSVIGYWDTFSFAAAGSVAVDPAPSESCPRRQITWRAGRSNGPLRRSTSTMFTAAGNVYRAGTSTVLGTVQAATNEFGTALASLSFDVQQGTCTYSRKAAAPFFYDAGASFEYVATNDWSVTGVAGTGSLNGGLVIRGGSNCPTLALYYVAIPNQTVTPTFARPPIFGPSGQALVVFLDGSQDRLEAAARAAGASGVWVQDEGGTFQLLAIGGPAFLGDQFRAKFPGGFTVSTSVLLVK